MAEFFVAFPQSTWNSSIFSILITNIFILYQPGFLQTVVAIKSPYGEGPG